jgi:hypothetical protein
VSVFLATNRLDDDPSRLDPAPLLSFADGQGQPLSEDAFLRGVAGALRGDTPLIVFLGGHGVGREQVLERSAAIARQQDAVVVGMSWAGGTSPTPRASIQASSHIKAQAYGFLELVALLLHGQVRPELPGRSVSLLVHGLGAKLLKKALQLRPDLVGELFTSSVLAAADLSYELQLEWLTRFAPRQDPDAVSVLWHDGDVALDFTMDGRLLHVAQGAVVDGDLLETQIGVFGDSDTFHAVPEFEYLDVSALVSQDIQPQPYPEGARQLDAQAVDAFEDEHSARLLGSSTHTYLWSSPQVAERVARLIRKGGAWT